MSSKPNTIKQSLEEIFKLFVGTNQLRPELQQPFTIDEYVYATNTHVMIKAPKSICDFKVENHINIPKVRNIYNEKNADTIIDITEAYFDEYKTEPETIAIGQNISCKTCYGSGTVEWKFEEHTKDDDCPVCDGDGMEHKVEHKRTGKMIVGNFLVKIENTYLHALNFYLLFYVQRCFGGPIKLNYITEYPGKALQFTIGPCEILIMPVTIMHIENIENLELYDGIIEIPLKA